MAKTTLVIGAKRPSGIGSRPAKVLPVKAGRVTGIRRALRKQDYDRIVVNAGELRPRRLRRTLRRADRFGGDTPVYAARATQGPRMRRKNQIIRRSGARIIGAGGGGGGAAGGGKRGGGGGGGGAAKVGWRQQPVIPGSAMTKGQLVRAARGAATTKYGPLTLQQRQAVGEAKAYQRDIGNYYQDYINQLQQQSQNVQNIGATAQQAVQNLQGGVTGLAGADLQNVQAQAQQQAVPGGAQPGDLAQMASNAAATRQALVGSFAAEQAARNAAASTYATNRANAVAPVQRLGAIATAAGRTRQAREKLAETQREKGAYKQQYKTETKADEFKNVLAAGALDIDLMKAKTAAKGGGGGGRETPREAGNKALAREGAKYGYGPQAWKALGPAGRRKVIRQFENKPDAAVITSGAFAGKTKQWVVNHPRQAQQLTDKWNRLTHPGKDGDGSSSSSKKNGPKLLTPGQSGTGLTQLAELRGLANVAKTGSGRGGFLRHGHKLSRYDAQRQIEGFATKVKHPALIRAAVDAVYDGHLSAYTQNQLRRAGYRPRDVAQSLHIPTHRQFVHRPANPYTRGPAPVRR